MTLLGWLKRRVAKDARRDEAEAAHFGDDPRRDDSSEDSDVDPFDPFPEPVLIEITDVFDLHTIPPRDVKRVVEEYLAEAHRKGFRSVRIIHGKGRGVQRETVRKILARTPFVRDFTDAPPEAGGLGATVAHLSPD
ncbi:MAG: Smr/MutS family protein [Acidobacteria bacterium]|nr:Smr/MutS family protein [Acidobacteriota bacterium]